MLKQDTPNLAEIKIREEVRKELLDEMSQEQLAQHLQERDRRLIALGLSTAMLFALVVPGAAVVLGFSWRLLLWAAGH